MGVKKPDKPAHKLINPVFKSSKSLTLIQVNPSQSKPFQLIGFVALLLKVLRCPSITLTFSRTTLPSVTVSTRSTLLGTLFNAYKLDVLILSSFILLSRLLSGASMILAMATSMMMMRVTSLARSLFVMNIVLNALLSPLLRVLFSPLSRRALLTSLMRALWSVPLLLSLQSPFMSVTFLLSFLASRLLLLATYLVTLLLT
jgi:hypothetical protein